MALTVEELVLQMSILSDKTDSVTNPNMVYKPAAALNKALDPSIFTGNNTKIVNAINMVAKKTNNLETTITSLMDKYNNILLDTSAGSNQAIWEATQGLMAKDTIIEGIKHILEGNRQEQILGLKAENIGKVLSIAKDEQGNLVTKAIDMIAGGGPIKALNVEYSNESKPELTNVSDALDYILANQTEVNVDWDSILHKPMIPNGLVMTEEALVMREDEKDISQVPLTSPEDINNIIGSLS